MGRSLLALQSKCHHGLGIGAQAPTPVVVATAPPDGRTEGTPDAPSLCLASGTPRAAAFQIHSLLRKRMHEPGQGQKPTTPQPPASNHFPHSMVSVVTCPPSVVTCPLVLFQDSLSVTEAPFKPTSLSKKIFRFRQASPCFGLC